MGVISFLFIKVLALLPRKLMSYCLGVLSRLELIPPLSYLLCKLFVVSVGIDMEEAEKPLSQYRSIEEVFTRKLKPGARPIAHANLVSSCDGFLTYSQKAHQEQAVQVKGITYSLRELVGHTLRHVETPLSFYQTIYLAPHNYHRVHSPVDGLLRAMHYIPGDLWPVNGPGVRYVPQIFVKNERLIFDIQLPGQGQLFLVMVGALNVGRMQSRFWPELTTNSPSAYKKPESWHFAQPHPLARGDELGVFMLGSTVVHVFNEQAIKQFPLVHFEGKKAIKMGQALDNI